MKTLISIFILFSSNLVLSEGLNLSVNPLVSYPEQLKQLKQDCKALGYPPECDAKEKAINKDMQELSRLCAVNKYDARCQSLKKKSYEYVSYLNQYCDDNPNADKCIRKREMKRRQQQELFKYCRTNPDSSRCRPKFRVKKKPPFMDRYCEKHGEENSCKRYFKSSGKRMPGADDEGKNNLF